jgi:hypothetical protein
MMQYLNKSICFFCDHTIDDQWTVTFNPINGKPVRESSGTRCEVVDYGTAFEGEGCGRTNFLEEVTVTECNLENYREEITSNWQYRADDNGRLNWSGSADSCIIVNNSGDYCYSVEYCCNYYSESPYYYQSSGCCSDEEFWINDGIDWSCSERLRDIYLHEEYKTESREVRHSEGGAFYRIIYDGCACGCGESCFVDNDN